MSTDQTTVPCPFDMCNAHDPERGCVIVLNEQEWDNFQRILNEKHEPTPAARKAARLHKEMLAHAKR